MNTNDLSTTLILKMAGLSCTKTFAGYTVLRDRADGTCEAIYSSQCEYKIRDFALAYSA